jgi:predicted small secreted protein
MRKVAILAVLAALMGCETVEGLGRDISNTENAVRDTF